MVSLTQVAGVSRPSLTLLPGLLRLPSRLLYVIVTTDLLTFVEFHEFQQTNELFQI